MATVQITQPRTINRGANPFAAIARQRNSAIVPTNNTSNIYESLQVRGDRVYNHPRVQQALENLRKRLNGKQYKQEHFGELVIAPVKLLDLNIDIQRDEDPIHIGEDIIERFDPRIAMPVMCTKLSNGRYSAWEGQQTSLAFYCMLKAGLITEDTLVQLKAFDEELEVPGTTLKGEAVGNMGFRVINGGGRKSIDAYHMHRSRVTGARVYNSTFREDLQSAEIQTILEKNNMFPDKASSAARNQALPGMVTYIHGLNTIANHDTEWKVFNECKHDLDWALAWHNKYYPNEKGVDGGFILAFGRFAAAARKNKPAIKLDATLETELYNLFRSNYGSPKGFHKECKQRLKDFQDANNLSASWRDECLLPILIADYLNKGGQHPMPEVHGMVNYAGV